MSNWRWLESTAELQEDSYGYSYEKFLVDEAGLTHYLDWNVTAAVQELAEIREEFSWKPWATDLPFHHRDRIRDEVIDVMHFLGNILTSVGVTDEELEAFYRAKQDINRRRQASGTYSAQKGGLPHGSESI